MQLAAFYNRQGKFDKTMEALNQRAAADPNNPEALLHDRRPTTGTRPSATSPLKDAERRDYIDKGLEAADKAIAIKADYLEAIVYKGLLLRLRGQHGEGPQAAAGLMKEADALRDRAKALQKARRRGRGTDQVHRCYRSMSPLLFFGPEMKTATRREAWWPFVVSGARLRWPCYPCSPLLAPARPAQPLLARLVLIVFVPAASFFMPSVTIPTFSTPAPLAASITATISP